MNLTFPIGVDLFSKIREDKYYYIDKTGFIKELLEKQFEAYLVTHPRRFGKTLTMSMLEVLIANVCKKYSFFRTQGCPAI